MFLFNTLNRRKEEFVPIDENNVRLYVCGPTVYDKAHLGNAKTPVVFDVLYRVLMNKFGKDKVTYVSNITDVDDKILNKHKETGKSIREITEQTYQWYIDDMAKLNVLSPNYRPRATEYINEMIEIAKKLLNPNDSVLIVTIDEKENTYHFYFFIIHPHPDLWIELFYMLNLDPVVI